MNPSKRPAGGAPEEPVEIVSAQRIPVLDRIDARIDAGECGADGAVRFGQTDLMNIIGCLDRPTSGDYLFLRS